MGGIYTRLQRFETFALLPWERIKPITCERLPLVKTSGIGGQFARNVPDKNPGAADHKPRFQESAGDKTRQVTWRTAPAVPSWPATRPLPRFLLREMLPHFLGNGVSLEGGRASERSSSKPSSRYFVQRLRISPRSRPGLRLMSSTISAFDLKPPA